jgi:hypothetical protein
VAGLVVGPILTALFVTIWEIYGVVFREALPQVQWLGPGPQPPRRTPLDAKEGEP